MSNGANNFLACGINRRGFTSYRGCQIVYGNCLNKCDNVTRNLTDWLQQRNIVLVPMKDKNVFPLLSIMYLDDVEDYYRVEDFPVKDLGFRGLLVLIHEDIKPRRQVEENVIQLRSEKTKICRIPQNEEEIERMLKFIKEKAKMLAFSHDRENPDLVLRDAVTFIEKMIGIRLVDVNDPPKDVTNVKGIEESPLVIFCKNESQLQQDIDNAKRKTRCGRDVMLLVLTNRKGMHLVDTKATEGFCMKSQLIFSSLSKKFRTRENQECTRWLHKFLLLNGYNVSIKVSRSKSLQRSFRKIRKREEEGLYEKLQNVSEEMERSVVIYLEEKQNLSLHRMQYDYQDSRPFILFCRDGESAEEDINQFIKERQATSDLHMTVVLLTCKGQKSIEIPNEPNIQRLLIHSSQEPTILPIPANGRVSDKVREFLHVKRFDKVTHKLKKEEFTHKAKRSSEEETKVSVANSVIRPPETSCKYVTQCDMRGSAQERCALPACDTDKSILEDKNRSCELVLNQDKKSVIPFREEHDQEIKNVLNPAIRTFMNYQVPSPPKDPTIHESNPRTRRYTYNSAKEIYKKNDRQSNARADIIHDNQETFKIGFHEGLISPSPFVQDILHESSRSSKDNDAHRPTPDAITKASIILESENEVKSIRFQPLNANSQQTRQQFCERLHLVPCERPIIHREQSSLLTALDSLHLTRHTSSKQPAVYFTYGQSRLIYRLMEAVKFIKAKGCIDPIEVKDIQKSPLLVFCDGRKSENIVLAKQSTRCGSDVMLIVVTDTEHTDLNLVEENEIFGASHTLIWDSKRVRFDEMDNQKFMEVLQKFLSNHNVIVNMKLTQTVPADCDGQRLVMRPRISIKADV